MSEVTQLEVDVPLEDLQRIQEISNLPAAQHRRELRSLLAKHPSVLAAVPTYLQRVEDRLISSVGGSSAIGEESVRAACGTLRAQLNYDNSSSVERLAIDQVVVTSMHVARTESQLAAAHQAVVGIWSREVTRARMSYLRAIRTLAQLRRLPVRQLMIAGQVNVFGKNSGHDVISNQRVEAKSGC